MHQGTMSTSCVVCGFLCKRILPSGQSCEYNPYNKNSTAVMLTAMLDIYVLEAQDVVETVVQCS
eukprot:TRINITY_DN2_c0_g1_i7.p2 TRINITY_DN2_c0_g1~~TRINITY_DN2_c0_g1_i7.p2  ORF type:complete len:64 (-),score=3.72 TRINITY_DN2_c0_g1_i7:242-433(-)